MQNVYEIKKKKEYDYKIHMNMATIFDG